MTIDDTWLSRAEDYLENKPTYITETYAEMLVGEAITEIYRLQSKLSQLREALVNAWAIIGYACEMEGQDWPKHFEELQSKEEAIKRAEEKGWPIEGYQDIGDFKRIACCELSRDHPEWGPWGEEDAK